MSAEPYAHDKYRLSSSGASAPTDGVPKMWPPRFLRQRMGHLAASTRPRTFREVCDWMAAAVLPPLMVALGLLMIFAALFRLGPQESTASVSAALVFAITGVALLVGVVVLRRSGGLSDNPQQVAAGTLIVTTTGVSVGMAAAGSLAETIFVVLLLACAGIAVLRTVWFVATISAIWLLWLGAAAFLSGSLEVGGYLLAMVVATFVALVVNAIRLSSLMAIVSAMDDVQAETVRDFETGLLNRRGLSEVGRELLALSRRYQEPVSCTVLEVLPGWDQQTDQRDDVISDVARDLVPAFRESDAMARWDSCQFVVLALGSGPRIEELEQRVLNDLGPLSGSVVTGGRVVHMPWQEEDVPQLVSRGIDEMYRRRAIQQARSGDDRDR